MSFRYVRLGALFSQDPQQARDQLAILFKAHGYNQSSVARELGVARSTVIGWCRKCVELGLSDPRESDVPQPKAEVPLPRVPDITKVRSYLGES